MFWSPRLSAVLHLLLHMAERPDVPMTSDEMASVIGTNPVVVRRTLAGLRRAGVVISEKGRGGGWRLARPLDRIALLEVERALAATSEPVVPVTPPGCLVERAVRNALLDAETEARAVLDRRLAAVSLADIAADAEALGLPRGTPGRAAHGL